jgi:hypothetical protein
MRFIRVALELNAGPDLIVDDCDQHDRFIRRLAKKISHGNQVRPLAIEQVCLGCPS